MASYFQKVGLFQTILFLFIMSLGGSVLAADLDAARVLPEGKVNIFEGGKKIGELSREAPLPVGKILQSNRKCGVRLDGIYLVSAENTRFSVRALSGVTDIFVEEGRVYFALGELKGPLAFSTPKDTARVESAVIEASTDTFGVKGYLLYEDGRMEIGVIEGGKLVLAHSSGRQVIEGGSSLWIQKAQADLGGGGAGAPAGEELSTKLVAGAVAGGIIGGLAWLDVFDDDDTPPTSPFRP